MRGAVAAALRHAHDAEAHAGGGRALSARDASCRSAIRSMTAMPPNRLDARRTRDALGAVAQRRTGSGSPAITIPHPPAWLGGEIVPEYRLGGLDLPPRAGRVLPAGRDRRPSASLHHGDDARAQPAPPLLRRGWRAHGAAGLRRLCRRARSVGARDRIRCSRGHSAPTCWAGSGSTRLPGAASLTRCGGRRATTASPAAPPSARSKVRRPADRSARNRRGAAPVPSGRW